MTHVTTPLPRARALSRLGTRAPSFPTTSAGSAGPAGPARFTDQDGVRFAVTEAVLVLTAVVTAALALPGPARLVVLGTVVLGAALALSWAASLGVALTAWATWTGFTEHRSGQLTLTPVDLEHLALLAAVAAVGVLAHRTVSTRHGGGRRG